MKKKSCTPINPKKYSCYGLKKNHTRNLITKKNSCSLKIPLPPITFLMVRPLRLGCPVSIVYNDILFEIAYHADVLRGSSPVPAPLRTSTWEAIFEVNKIICDEILCCVTFFAFAKSGPQIKINKRG